MSTCVELGDGTETLIRIETESDRASLITAFAERCFMVGNFPSRGGGHYRWLLDCRQGLGSGLFARGIATAMLDELRTLGIRQFAGSGFGSFFLTGAMLALGHDLRAGLLRNEPKSYGHGHRVEGDLDAGLPVCVVDDVINSGKSASHAIDVLQREGFDVTTHLSIFSFSSGAGVSELEHRRVQCKWLASVHEPRRTQHPKTPCGAEPPLIERCVQRLLRLRGGR